MLDVGARQVEQPLPFSPAGDRRGGGGGGGGAQTYFFPPSFFFLFHASCSSVEKESLVDLSLSQ